MLSVIIITKNEAHHLARCLQSVQWADEIIVVDSGSTDNTVEVAKKYTSHVTVEADWQGYGVQKQRALDRATGDWVLNIDADEVVSEALKLKLLEIMTSEHEALSDIFTSDESMSLTPTRDSRVQSIDACRIPIVMIFNNQRLEHTSSPKRHIRFFRRKGAKFSEEIIHEGIVLPDNSHIIQLKEPLLHYSFRDFSHALYKLNRYSSYTAKTRLYEKKSMSLTKAILRSLWMFISSYIVRFGFLDGKLGFIFAVYTMEGTFYRAIKQLYPDQNLYELPSVE